MRVLTLDVAFARPRALPWRSILIFALERVPGMVALAALPLWFHLTFSHLGFNPTDEGFTLAYSRRLLEGQIPHRDFITIRPAGSPLLHTPEVLLGGDRAFWLSRGVAWLELGVVAWASVTLLTRLLRVSPPWWARLPVAVVAFLFSAHTFPVMAWHTIDGLFLSGLGLAAITTRWTPAVAAGYALLGLAALTKQNFAAVGPVALLLTGDWRRGEHLLAFAAAPLAYTGLLVQAGGIDDAAVQLFTETSLRQTGWIAYVSRPTLLGFAAVGFLATHLSQGGQRVARLAGALVLAGIVGWAALGLSDAAWWQWEPFAILAAAAGSAAWSLTRGVRTGPFRAGALAVTVAWAASISVGYNTPALAAGLLAAYLLLEAWRGLEALQLVRVAYLAPVGVAAILAWTGAVGVRHQHIYRDAPASQLVYDLGGIFPGAAGIKTNATTYAVAADLQRAIELTAGQRYAIMPEFAAYWVQADQENPLPLDWLYWLEMNDPRLRDRILWQMDAQRGSLVVLVQKVSAAALPGLAPPAGDPWITSHVQATWTPVAETEYFVLYQ